MYRLTRRLFSITALTAALAAVCGAQPRVPVVSATNTTMRVMAANITTGNNQRYEAPGLRIFQGLKPDVVAVQEFNYASTNGLGVNTPAAIREMIDRAFGTNFAYFRETGYAIPNGIISRWPIVEAGSWEDLDAGVNDRGFAWARINVPGPDDLYVVSVHLKASSSDAPRRAAEAAQIKSLIESNIPPGSFLVVAGDFNTDARTEAAMATFRTFLSDTPVPADNNGNPNTNQSRQRPYDYVLPSFTLASNQVPVVIGAQNFANGLVFDSRVYSPLNDVSPVVSTDSSAVNMQHMGVIKDFRLAYGVTNWVPLPQPLLHLLATNLVHWTGPSNLTYTVQRSGSLTNWSFAGTANSATTNYWFTNTQPAAARTFWRVVYP